MRSDGCRIEIMPQNVESQKSPETELKTSEERNQRRWFPTPEPIKHIFNRFPIRTYAPNAIPSREMLDRTKHHLYIFTTDHAARLGSPSFNPGCLKWQAYLRFLGIAFSIVPSNNHASPSGALPFLIPSTSTPATRERISAIPSFKFQQWAQEVLPSTDLGSNPDNIPYAGSDSNQYSNSKTFADSLPEVIDPRNQGYGSQCKACVREPFDIRHEAYVSLIDRSIRTAWLFFLYLEPANFTAIAYPLYITSCSTNYIVRMILAYNLRAAARLELLKQSTIIDVEALYKGCQTAFLALSELLGECRYFFAVNRPGLFDACVFAYTNTLLDQELQWPETRMVRLLEKHGNLVRHRWRIFEQYFKPTIN